MDDRETMFKVGAVALLVFGGFAVYLPIRLTANKKMIELATEVSEKIETKMIEDIRKTDTIELKNDFSIDLTGIQLNDGSYGYITNEERGIDFFGVGNDEKAYKLSYDLTKEQLEKLNLKPSFQTNKTNREAIKVLEEIFQELEISKLEVNDLGAVNLGLNNEEDFKALAKALGPAVPTNKIIKNNQNVTADAFLPLYSNIEIKEIEGETVAIMTIEGLQLHHKEEANLAAGIATGMIVGEYFDSPITGYAVGVTVAYSTASKSSDVYTRKEEVMIKLSEKQKLMSNKELREEIMSAILSNTQKYTKNTKYMSKNLSQHRNNIYSKIVEFGKNK